MSISKIVVGTDFSEYSDVAVKHAMAIARQQGAELTLVHALSMPDIDYGIAESVTPSDLYKKQVSEIIDNARAQLDTLREKLHGQGVAIAHVFVDAMPDRGIVKVAQEMDADLIVMGSHGRTGLSRFLLGSVAEKVARFATCDVLVARGKAHAGGFQRVLVPVDFSEMSELSVRRSAALVAKGGRVQLLHCWHLPGGPVTYWGKVGPGLKESIVKGAKEYGQKYIENYKNEDAIYSFSCEEGDPRGLVEKHFEAGECDLIIMGSHGRKGVNRLLLGSVSETVIRHIKGAVYIVRQKKNLNQEGGNQ